MRGARAVVGITALALLSTICSSLENPNEVPFTLYRGYVIVVRGSLGSLNNLNLLVDTGAVPSVIDSRIARKLNLAGKMAQLDAPNKTLATEQVILPDVHLGPLHIGELPVLVQDLSFVETSLGIRVDAMIGFDVIGGSAFTIDYESKKLVFGSIDPSFSSVPYAPGLPYAIVILYVQQERLEILVDTGASSLVLFPKGLRNCRLPIQRAGWEKWTGMGGEISVAKAELSAAYLGNVPWGERVAYIASNDSHLSGPAGLLGTVTLGKRVAFDPVRKVVAWQQRKQ